MLRDSPCHLSSKVLCACVNRSWKHTESCQVFDKKAMSVEMIVQPLEVIKVRVGNVALQWLSQEVSCAGVTALVSSHVHDHGGCP